MSAAEMDLIQPGDKVGIQFTCRFPNGEIAASTSSAVAKDSSLRKSLVYLPRSKDDPLEVTAGLSAATKSFPVPMLDEIVARIAASLPRMTLGKTRTIEIRSERPADVPEKEQFLQLARIRELPKEIRMTGDEYKSRTGKDPEVGAEYALDPLLPAKVASVSQNEVLIRSSAQPGSVVETPFGKGTILENGNQVEIVIEAAAGTLVRMGPVVGRISDAQDKMFTIDFGNPFGGEPLTCEVKVEPISQDKLSKKDK
jgi:FKBP-type peptidyl-prolyl cis-trans isomerase 2